MADPINNPSSTAEFPTILGPDATFKGELSFEKGMRIQGRFEGRITTPGRLQVSKEAKLQADVEAGSITVEGDVRGNLTANDRIELKSTARYEGDLRTSKLIVDEGAVFVGNVSVGPDAVKTHNNTSTNRNTTPVTPSVVGNPALNVPIPSPTR